MRRVSILFVVSKFTVLSFKRVISETVYELKLYNIRYIWSIYVSIEARPIHFVFHSTPSWKTLKIHIFERKQKKFPCWRSLLMKLFGAIIFEKYLIHIDCFIGFLVRAQMVKIALKILCYYDSKYPIFDRWWTTRLFHLGNFELFQLVLLVRTNRVKGSGIFLRYY